jgi:hypothetical protein
MFWKSFCIKTACYVLTILRGYETMKQQNQNPSGHSSLIVGLALFFIIIFIGSIPVIAPQIFRYEKLVPRASVWPITARSTRESIWKSSDGTTANYVNINNTASGLNVTVHPTELIIREGFLIEDLITKDTFKISTNVEIPISCHSGVAFRGNAQGEYYLFMVSPCGKTYTVEILQRESGHDLPREAIIPNTNYPDTVGQPLTLTVVGNGASYYFYINGVYVDQMFDSRLNGNRVGVEILKCAGPSDEITFGFSDLVLSSPEWQLPGAQIAP